MAAPRALLACNQLLRFLAAISESSGGIAFYTLLSRSAMLSKESAASVATCMSAAPRLMLAVSGLGIATQKRPAALAEAMPFGESSRATAS